MFLIYIYKHALTKNYVSTYDDKIVELFKKDIVRKKLSSEVKELFLESIRMKIDDRL